MSTTPLLHLYVNPAWNRKAIHTPLLFPFWGNPNQDSSLFAKEMFDAYQFDTSLYAITDNLSEANMVLAPYRHVWFLRHDKALWEECIRTAKEAGLPLLVDGVGDIEYPVEVPNSYVLRIGGYRFIKEEGRVVIPAAADDLLERCCGGKLQIREKTDGKSVVGFAGWAKLSLVQHIKTILKELPMRVRGVFDDKYRAMQKGVLWRTRAIQALERSSDIALRLKVRPSFSGSARTASGDMRQLRQDFVDTVLGSDYCLDVRGDANASTRLFEILSLGRIPVIVDTERNLPFSDELDYREFSLVVDFRDIAQLPEIVAEFHKTVTPEQFEAMQHKAREVFVSHFRIDAQMKHILKDSLSVSC
jgi:hypothetical protein